MKIYGFLDIPRTCVLGIACCNPLFVMLQLERRPRQSRRLRQKPNLMLSVEYAGSSVVFDCFDHFKDNPCFNFIGLQWFTMVYLQWFT